MATKYDDIYMRDNLNDQGEIPTSGTLSHSPDIIPYGSAPKSDPVKFFKSNWDQDVGKNLTADAPNYIYLRGKNLAPGEASARLHLYHSKASLLLYPHLWKDNGIKTSKGSDAVNVNAKKQGDIVVTDDPFKWKPEMISGDHYCLVGRVVTDRHPNPIPDTGEISDFAKYVAEHPNIAWRNVVVTDVDKPTFTQSVDYAQGTGGGVMHVMLCCKSLPVGSEVAFSCGTPGPQPLLNLNRIKVDNSESFDVGITSNIPAGFESNIAYSYWSNGLKPLPGFTLSLVVFYFVSPANEEVYRLARPLEEHNLKVPEEHILLGAGLGVGPVKAIKVGGHTTVGL